MIYGLFVASGNLAQSCKKKVLLSQIKDRAQKCISYNQCEVGTKLHRSTISPKNYIFLPFNRFYMIFAWYKHDIYTILHMIFIICTCRANIFAKNKNKLRSFDKEYFVLGTSGTRFIQVWSGATGTPGLFDTVQPNVWPPVVSYKTV